MDNKTSLTPELKQIYDRVMNSAEESAKTPENVKQENTESQQQESPMPTPEVNQTPVVESMGQEPIPPAPEVPKTEPQPVAQAAMAGTVTSEVTKKSRKPLFIILSLVFVLAWAFFWAVIFGFIKF